MTPAEQHAILIRKAIAEARAAGVNVNLDWDEDEDGIHVSLNTSVHRRFPTDHGKVIIIRINYGPRAVEAN